MTPPDQSQLAQAWEKQFPGNSHLITTLRDQLIFADSERLLTHRALQTLQLTITELPIHLWSDNILTLQSFLRKEHSRAQQDFQRALQILQSTNSKTPIPEPPAPPAPEGAQVRLYQTIRVSIVDGKTITNASPTAAFYLEKNLWHLTSAIVRQYEFKNAIIPDEYAYVLKHKGRDYLPYDCISIAYATEIFKSLCEQEIATNAPHLLDGERISLHQMNGKTSGFANYKDS